MNRRTRRMTVGMSAVAVAAAAGVALTTLPGDSDGSGSERTKADASTSGTRAAQGAEGAEGAHDAHSTSGSHEHPADAGTLGSLTGKGSSGRSATFFAGSLNGANEVPVQGGPAVGDEDGRALALMGIKGDQVSFAFKFRGIAAPTAAHIHQGEKGANGAIKIPFFARKVADGRTTVTGTVRVKDRELLNSLREKPNGFYFNLHTGEFPGGAVRGQVNKLSTSGDMKRTLGSFQASVVKGSQVYKCTRQPAGGYAFTQDNVRARLGGGIRHFFAKPGPSGPPAWVARDRSAVTGQLVSKTPNGNENIPELDLRAKQAGKRHGLFSQTEEILRLNTRGGVAPKGSCDPEKQLRKAVPYQADYVFITW